MILASLLFARFQDPLIEVVEGDLPIVLTAPHGGTLSIPGATERVGKDIKQFVTVLDTRTDELARQSAKEVEKLFGKKPWVVIAKFSRKYADVNRPIESGTESEAAKAQYKLYHEAIRKAVDKVREKFGTGVLLDIHGQGSDKDLVFRGTQNLKTVKGISDVQLFGPNSILGSLEAQGVKISPTVKDAHEKENPKLNGGYTVQTYGLNQKDGVMAIQLEFGGSYRAAKAIPDTATKIAKALDKYAKLFLTY